MTSDSERQQMQQSIDDTERPTRHNRDVFHAWMLQGAKYAGPLDMPVLQRVEVIPNKLVAFSDVMHRGWEDYDCWVHFFEDDCVIEVASDLVVYEGPSQRLEGPSFRS